ncbi:MAG: hypothetical protein WDZ76_00290 [Pseudohongiellaceae bacterium]
MSCPRTQHLLVEYFADDLLSVTRQEINHHLRECNDCKSELNAALSARDTLAGWRGEAVPHWGRGVAEFKAQHHGNDSRGGLNWAWQWMPTAACAVMATIMLLQTSITADDSGFSIGFGVQAENQVTHDTLDQRLASFQQNQLARQEQQLGGFLTRVDELQNDNNRRLLQAVSDQTEQATAENLERIYTYFEQQRQQDLQTLQAGYQQLYDSDYETIRSMQQLANYIGYEGAQQ